MALSDGLIGYWKLDEVSGSRIDSKNSSTLTDNGSVGSTSGIISNAANFSGSNYLSCAVNSNLIVGFTPDDFTINCWARFVDNNTNYTIISSTTDGTAQHSEYWLINESGLLFMFVGDGTQYSFSYTPINATTTYMITTRVVRSPTFHIYLAINGSPVTDNFTLLSGFSGSSFTASKFNIGSINNGTSSMKGWIDEVGLWRRNISDGEVTSLYNSGAGLAYENFAPLGFDGVIPVGFMGLMMNWSSGVAPPVFTGHSKIPITRRRG